MKVYTKKGDGGSTQLIGGRRVPKNSIKIEAYGTVDELNSFLGLLRDQEIQLEYKEQLIHLQNDLFVIGSLLAKDKDAKMALPELKEESIDLMEQWIDEMDAQLEPMRFFVLPGGHQAVSLSHIARCVCRRAERCVVDLGEQEEVPSHILKFLNRLSDYLFVLGRKLSADLNIQDVPWKPEK